MYIEDEPFGRLEAYELVGVNDVTMPIQILPCRHCAPWYVEVYRRDDDTLAVREWHHADCRHLLALVQEEAGATG